MEVQLDFMSEKREDFEISDHLLILADSAELVQESALAGSNHNLDQEKRMRLSQAKRLARSGGHFELQQNDSCMDGLMRKTRTGNEGLVRRAVEEVADKQLDQKNSEGGDCSSKQSDKRKEVVQPVSGSTRRRYKRTSRLRPEAQQEKGRQCYTTSEYLLAMLRRS